MKKLFLLSFFLMLSFYASASKIVVSTDIGFDPNDSTSFLEIALTNTVADTIVIDNVGMDWNTGPLDVNRDDITIILERGVIVRALPGVFGQFDSLIRLRDTNNVKILGYGAQLIMNKQEYIDLADSEFRHGIDLNSAINIWIEGLTIRDSGGDGISVSKSFAADSPQNYSENITILNCVSNNNYRQGLAIISASSIDVLYSEFSDTSGTLPEDGIDIEPFEPDQRIENVLIKGCRILNNNGNAIQVAMDFMDDSSPDISIVVEDTYMSGNHDPANTFAFAELNLSDNNENGVDGFVSFSNCYVDSSEWTAAYISKTVDSYEAIFENCVFKDVSNDPIAFNNPIFFEVTNYDDPVARFGGATFTDCTIIYDEDIPFIDLVENLPTSPGLGNVNGNFFVVNPNNVNFETGTNPENATITFELFASVPETEVNISATQIEYSEFDDLEFLFSVEREADNLFPTAVNVSYDGTTSFGDDYNRQPGFVLFPEGQDIVETSIGIVNDQEEENEELVVIEIEENVCYSVGPNASIELELSDAVLSTEDFGLNTITVFPNPAENVVNIGLPQGDYEVVIISILGERLEELRMAKNGTIRLDNYSSGMYFLQIYNEQNQILNTIKLIKK